MPRLIPAVLLPGVSPIRSSLSFKRSGFPAVARSDSTHLLGVLPPVHQDETLLCEGDLPDCFFNSDFYIGGRGCAWHRV